MTDISQCSVFVKSGPSRRCESGCVEIEPKAGITSSAMSIGTGTSTKSGTGSGNGMPLLPQLVGMSGVFGRLVGFERNKHVPGGADDTLDPSRSLGLKYGGQVETIGCFGNDMETTNIEVSGGQEDWKAGYTGSGFKYKNSNGLVRVAQENMMIMILVGRAGVCWGMCEFLIPKMEAVLNSQSKWFSTTERCTGWASSSSWKRVRKKGLRAWSAWL